MSDKQIKPVTSRTRTVRVVGLITYFIVCLLFATYVLVMTWPKNRGLQKRFHRDVAINLIVEVTADSIQQIHKAEDVLSRWQVYGSSRITPDDQDDFVRGVALATDVSKKPIHTFSLLQNPKRVTPDDVERLQAVLHDGVSELQTREILGDGFETNTLPTVFYGSIHHFVNNNSPPLEYWQDKALPGLTKIERADLQKRSAALLDKGNASSLGSPDLDFLAVLVAFGIIGGAIQGMSSLARYVGDQKFMDTWTVYYVARPLLGAVLAVAIYLVLRAGIVKTDNVIDVTNTFAASGLAMLAGLFTAEIMEKLRDIANTVFTGKNGRDAIDSSKPHISDIKAYVTGMGWEWIIIGTSFRPDSIVYRKTNDDKDPVALTDESAPKFQDGVLHVKLPLPADSARYEVTVFNPDPNQATSQPFVLRYGDPQPKPAPQLPAVAA